MNRRPSRVSAALLALVFVLSTPSAFAATRDSRSEGFGITRIVRFVKKIVRTLAPAINEDPGVTYPTPPKP